MESPKLIGKTCEFPSCAESAIACAALTDSDSIVLAHRYVCDIHAQEMFAVKVAQISREEQLRNAINRVRAASSANERVAEDEKILDEIL